MNDGFSIYFDHVISFSISASKDNTPKITKMSFSISASNNNNQRNSFSNAKDYKFYTNTNPKYSTQTYNPKKSTTNNGYSRLLKKPNSSRNFLGEENTGLLIL